MSSVTTARVGAGAGGNDFRRRNDRQAPGPPPVALSVIANNIPIELRAMRRWILWRYAWRDGKWKKQPISASTRRAINATRPENGCFFAEAYRSYKRLRRDGVADGVGFILAEADGLVGVDLDDIRVPETGEIDYDPEQVVRSLGSYAEASPSGSGVRILVRGRLPFGGRRRGHCEVYARQRYVTITGYRLKFAARKVASNQGALDQLVQRWFPNATATVGGGVAAVRRGANAGVHEVRGRAPDLDDEEVVARIRANGKYARLWAGDHGDYRSESEATLALLQRIIWFVGNDAQRIDHLFRQSAMMRPKWDSPRGSSTWGQIVIAKALQTHTGRRGGALAPKEKVNKNRESHTPLYSLSVSHDRDPVAVIHECVPDRAPRDLGREMLHLARRLKALDQLAGAPIKAFKPLLREWYRLSSSVLRGRTYPTVWAKFLVAYGSAKTAAGDGRLDRLWRQALAVPRPPEARRYPADRSLQLLAALGSRLQDVSGDHAFFLDCRSAARLLGVSRATAARKLSRLVADGVLKLVRKGTRESGKASEYVFLRSTPRVTLAVGA
jgi:hypothetical protein